MEVENILWRIKWFNEVYLELFSDSIIDFKKILVGREMDCV